MLVRGKYALLDASLPDALKNDWAVLVCDTKVADMGPYDQLKALYPDEEVVGDGKQLLMPGLIDSHTHGAGLSYIQRGVTYDFLENSLLDFDSSMDLEPETNSMLNAVRHIQNGCTTIHHNNWSMPLDEREIEKDELKISAYEKTGIRLGFSLGIRNKNILAYDDVAFHKTLPPELQKETEYMISFDKEAAASEFLSAFEHLYKKYNGERTRIFMGPSWVQGSTDSFLQKVKERSDQLGKLPIHLHCLQTPIQKAFGLRAYGKSLVGHLEDIGLVDENLVLGHAVYLTQEDIELLAAKKAAITHHASCNLAMRNGIAPVYAATQAGLCVALGMDEKSINDDEDAFMEMRMIFYLHRQAGIILDKFPALTPKEVFQMALNNGAKASGFKNEIGILQKGYQADIILLDLDDILNNPWSSPECDLLTLVMHRALGRCVNTVIIGGSMVMKDRKILTIDVDALYEEVRKQGMRGPSKEQSAYRDMLHRVKPYYQKWYNSWISSLEFEPFYNMNSRT